MTGAEVEGLATIVFECPSQKSHSNGGFFEIGLSQFLQDEIEGPSGLRKDLVFGERKFFRATL